MEFKKMNAVDRNAIILGLVFLAALSIFFVQNPENILVGTIGILGGALTQK